MSEELDKLALQIDLRKLDRDEKAATLDAKLFDALARAQSAFPVIPKNREVDVVKNGVKLYSFKYADLTEIIDAIRPALTANGLSFTQRIARNETIGSHFVTVVMHSSGASAELGHVPIIIPNGGGMKEIAGACTYGKRLSLSAALGVSAEEDVDAPPGNGETAKAKDTGRTAAKIAPRTADPKPAAAPAPTGNDEKASAKLLKQILEVAQKNDHSARALQDYVKELFGVEKSTELTTAQATELGRLVKSSTPDEMGVLISNRRAEKAQAEKGK